jgi:hypothetical protein
MVDTTRSLSFCHYRGVQYMEDLEDMRNMSLTEFVLALQRFGAFSGGRHSRYALRLVCAFPDSQLMQLPLHMLQHANLPKRYRTVSVTCSMTCMARHDSLIGMTETGHDLVNLALARTRHNRYCNLAT